ncbi:MAG: hypothetical protein RPU64_08410 [Candidatus Sedimenticola sp. (ex Thyasira tokunagai)]
MKPPGKELYRAHDELGIVSVIEDAGKRVLTFGNEIEQSAYDTQQPLHLYHRYTQLMLLGYLFVDRPHHCTLLGLGGGSLARTLFHLLPHCRIDAVEQRAIVAEAAHQWFDLPRDKRLNIHIADAGDYLLDNPPATDLLFTDLYLAGGMDKQQAQQSYLAACRSVLKPGGVLVANFWLGAGATSFALNHSLQEVFDQQTLTVDIPDGNCVAFAFDGGLPKIQQKQFIHQAEILGKQIATPMQRQARLFCYQNRQQLRLRRVELHRR